MLVQRASTQDIQSANLSSEVAPKCKICTLNCTLEEIAAHIGKSERTVKTITVNLTEKGIIERKTAKETVFGRLKTCRHRS